MNEKNGRRRGVFYHKKRKKRERYVSCHVDQSLRLSLAWELKLRTLHPIPDPSQSANRCNKVDCLMLLQQSEEEGVALLPARISCLKQTDIVTRL